MGAAQSECVGSVPGGSCLVPPRPCSARQGTGKAAARKRQLQPPASGNSRAPGPLAYSQATLRAVPLAGVPLFGSFIVFLSLHTIAFNVRLADARLRCRCLRQA